MTINRNTATEINAIRDPEPGECEVEFEVDRGPDVVMTKESH